VRNALILLAAVALLIVTAGAVNHAVAFDVDWVAGTWRTVSLFWVGVTVAVLVIVAGLAAALLGRAGAVRAQRKLETELDASYRRMRELETAAPVAQTADQRVPSAATTAAITAGASPRTPPPHTPTPRASSPQGMPGSQTAVTVVAADGSAKVTQVLPVTSEQAADAAEATDVTREADAAGDDAAPPN
jgi:hypothetical protein